MKNIKIKNILIFTLIAMTAFGGLVGCGKEKPTPVNVSELLQIVETERNIKQKEQNAKINLNMKVENNKNEKEDFSVTALQKSLIDNEDSDSKIMLNIKRNGSLDKDNSNSSSKMMNNAISAFKDKEIVFKTRDGKGQIDSKSIKNILRAYLDTNETTSDDAENLGGGIIGFIAETIPNNSYISVPSSGIENISPANIILNGFKDSVQLFPVEEPSRKKLSNEERTELSKLYNDFVENAFGSYIFVNMTKNGNTLIYKANNNKLAEEIDSIKKYIEENKNTIKSELIKLSKETSLIQNVKELTEEEAEEISKVFFEKIEGRLYNDYVYKLEDNDFLIDIKIETRKDGSELNFTVSKKPGKRIAKPDNKSDKNSDKDTHEKTDQKLDENPIETELVISGSIETKANSKVQLKDFEGEEIPVDQLFSGLLYNVKEKDPDWN